MIRKKWEVVIMAEYVLEYEETVKRTYASVDRDDEY